MTTTTTTDKHAHRRKSLPLCERQSVLRACQGGVSVDCITDLDDNQSRLLEALQLSLPVEGPSNRKKHKRDRKLSLNPIYQQVPRVLDCCCQHLEKYGEPPLPAALSKNTERSSRFTAHRISGSIKIYDRTDCCECLITAVHQTVFLGN